MPQAGAEPHKKQAAIGPALTENRNVQQVVPEEGAQGDVPALPELGNVLAQKGMPEVFVKMKAE